MERKAVSRLMLTLLAISMLTLAFNIQPAKADGTVSGKVTESDGVTPIEGALVEALQQGDLVVSSTTTGSGGVYSLTLPVGAYKMRASANNYLTAIKPVVNVTSGTTTVDFNLSRGQMLVFDEFIGTSLDTSKWNSHFTGLGYVSIYNATGEPTKFSAIGCGSGYGGAGSVAITSKLNASLDSTIIFEGRVSAYSEGHWYPGVYGDKQPRGLRVGTDPNNAIEFISYARDTVEARTVASGIATTSQYVLPPGKKVDRTSEWDLIYRIEANSTCVKFYVNDVLIATHTTNIPTGQLNIYMGTSYGGYGNVPVSADYLYMAVSLPPTPPTPLEALEELIQTVETWDLDFGIETSLTSKLQAAYHLLDKENQNAATGQLTAFMNEAEALRLKKLTNEEADQLISEAQRIIDLING